jgi:putative transposase
MVKRATTPSFVTEIPLKVDSALERKLLVRLDVNRMVYNAALGEALKRLDRMRESDAYRRARGLTEKMARKAAFRKCDEDFGFSDGDLRAWTKQFTNSWLNEHVDSQVVQRTTTRAFEVVSEFRYNKRGRPHFKRKGECPAAENQHNNSGLRWKDGHVVWGNLTVPPIIDPADEVMAHGLACRVKSIRLLTRDFNGRRRFFVQLVNEGQPHSDPALQLGEGTIGIDPGPAVFAIAGNDWGERVDLRAGLAVSQAEVRRLQRHIDRQRRANNPDNFLPDGRVKTGPKSWVVSGKQKDSERKLREWQRKGAALRKSLHGELVNAVLATGDTFMVEKNEYKAFQRGRYGRSVGLAAPGEFVARLKQKAERFGATAKEVATFTTRLSQFCHGCGTVERKPLSLRVHECACGVGPVQRDLYSAWLARFAVATSGPQGPVWRLDASRADEAWEGAGSRLPAASRSITVREFALTRGTTRESAFPKNAVPANESSGEERVVGEANRREVRPRVSGESFPG